VSPEKKPKLFNRVATLVADKARREGRRITQRVIQEETGLAANTVSGMMRNANVNWHSPSYEVILAWLNEGVRDPAHQITHEQLFETVWIDDDEEMGTAVIGVA
jgi:transcriptional regulator with XRE-family HTH domain